MNKNHFSRIAALATAGVFAFSLSACGDTEDKPTETPAPVETTTSAPAPVELSTAPVETEKPAPAPAEPVMGATDVTGFRAGSWADLSDIKAPEGADKIWGDEAAVEGVNYALDAMFNLYIAGDVTGLTEDDTNRTVEDFSVLHNFTTDTLSETLDPIVEKAVAGDVEARGTLRWFFPQARFDNTIEFKGKRVLDTVTPNGQSYFINNATIEVVESDSEFYLNVTVNHTITYNGTLNGEAASATTVRNTRFSMLPAGDGSWKIDGIGVETVSAK